MTSAKTIKTPTVDKNGKSTHVYKKPVGNVPATKRAVPAPTSYGKKPYAEMSGAEQAIVRQVIQTALGQRKDYIDTDGNPVPRDENGDYDFSQVQDLYDPESIASHNLAISDLMVTLCAEYSISDADWNELTGYARAS